MVRKVLVSLALMSSVAFSEVLYTDGSQDIKTCVKPEVSASLKLPCDVKDLYFTPEIEASVSPKSPNNVVFMIEKGKEGAITAVCRDYSYTFLIKSGENCDNHKELVDKRIIKGDKEIDIAKFDKERTLNKARSLLAGMVKGEMVRGFEIKPLNVLSVIDHDDFFKIRFFKLYEGSILVGYVGVVKNYSKYVRKVFDPKKIMKKGYMYVYLENIENPVFEPEEERLLYIVALRGSDKIPYVRR